MPTTRQGTTIEMGGKETQRKRRSSSISHTTSGALTSRQRKDTSKQAHTERVFPPTTPRRSRKKVRFSDPGPQLQETIHDSSTGLTPALLRTSLGEFGPEHPDILTRTPTRRSRRQSTPALRSTRSYDSLSSFDAVSPGQVVQFTPFRQILDLRTQRRIRRTGLSDEMNQYEQEKREIAKHNNAIQRKDAELAALRKELNAVRDRKCDTEENTDAARTASLIQIENLEAEICRLREELSKSATHSPTDCDNAADGDEDTIMINACDPDDDDDSVIVSNSPKFRNIDYFPSPVSDRLSPLASRYMDADASAQADIPGPKGESEILALSHDLEVAKKEKRELFNAFRALPALDGMPNRDIWRLTSPPPDFLDQIVPILTAALTRASDAARTLDSVRQNLSNLGFQGNNADDVISEMRSRFRSARLELERAAPGETANANLEDGSATLSALVKRVKLVVEKLEEEQKRHHGSLGREKALRGQFDALLVRNEEASKKIGDLEEAISISSDNILNTTTRMEQLERDGKEQAVEIERLNAALNKYCDEVRRLEALVTSLEAENTASKERHSKEVSDLETKIASEERVRRAAESLVAEHESRIRELDEIVQDNRIYICDLIAKVEALEREHQRAMESQRRKAATQQQHHEHEMGSMNVRISELSTSLEGAKSEVAKLRQRNSGLEEQLQLEIKAKNDLIHEWISNQAQLLAAAKETINAERRSAKIREANRELLSDDLQSNPGSEPITPVSMTKYVDVEAGRGKSRRRLDSGIGILTDEDYYADAQLQRCLNSDIELPSSDPVTF